MKKKCVIILIIITIVIIMFLAIIVFFKNRNHINKNSRDENLSQEVDINELIYDYDENSNQYIIYDDTGNIRGTAEDDYELSLYKYDKDYDPSLRPPGL